jgi:hypothetical protein
LKNILVLSYYFTPDLSAGSFRNTALVKELSAQLGNNGMIHVITTQPNRYKTFTDEALATENWGSNVQIHRIKVPVHYNGFRDQINSFRVYYTKALELSKLHKIDMVYASSSKLFTAYLGKVISGRNNCKLYLDIRDIFVETMVDVLKHRPVLKVAIIKAVETFIERPTFRKAVHINLVSEGFEDYFRSITDAKLSFFPNGIDDVFVGLNAISVDDDGPKVITYAGNIGEGQGLEKIIPECAKALGPKFHFKIIGDGGTRRLLEEVVKKENLTNVEVLNPVKRDELVEIYKNSHFLFLHLNDYKAFERVLPSKLFEYGATNLPMIAGVNGYARKFVHKNITNSFVFDPCDSATLVQWLQNYSYRVQERKVFVQNFHRHNISRSLVNSILSYLEPAKQMNKETTRIVLRKLKESVS